MLNNIVVIYSRHQYVGDDQVKMSVMTKSNLIYTRGGVGGALSDGRPYPDSHLFK